MIDAPPHMRNTSQKGCYIMFKYLRNEEIWKEMLLSVILLFFVTFVGSMAEGFPGAVLCMAVGLIFSVLHFISSYRRYQQIARLSNKVNRYLHGYMELYIQDQKEGELAILESEIGKMVLRLRNQAHLLKEDKIYLSDSIADISHQIRTPLTTMNLIVSRLSSRELPEEKRKHLIMELEEMLVHIDWLIQSLLTISKLDAGTIQMQEKKVFVPELIHNATEALEIPMELRQQRLDIVCEPTVSFTGDMKWMKEALMNIVKNCMEHTPKGGRVQICAVENPIYTEIVVEDNGPGIAREDLPHLFERFYKGKNSSDKSVGIGLALAKMIITGQRGNVSAENVTEKGKVCGAKFVVRFYKSIV